MGGLRRMLAPLVLLLALIGGSTVLAAGGKGERWIAAWGTSQQIPEERNALKSEDLKDATLRQIVRIQIGGKQFRIRFSNAFGTQPLTIGAATVAASADNASSRIKDGSLMPVQFGGKASVTIPAGAEYWS
ncbi:MAG: SGNH/GDSL hydrolase family protein, partial [Sphingomonas sp.]